MHLREEGVHRKLPPSTAVPVADPSNASRTQSRAWRVKRVNSFLAISCGGMRPLCSPSCSHPVAGMHGVLSGPLRNLLLGCSGVALKEKH